MTITDLAPEPVHVRRRNNGVFVSGGHIEDMNAAQAAFLTSQVRVLIESMPSHPQVTPPSWVTSGPDGEGNYDGLSGRVGEIGVSSSWSPGDGPRMWLDAVLYDGGDMTPAAARSLAALLSAVADSVESKAPESSVSTRPGVAVGRDGTTSATSHTSAVAS